MTDIVKTIVQEPSIIKKLEQKYPTIKKLFDEKPEQTLNKLKAHILQVDHRSNEDNYKAWDDYLPAIESYLAKICKDMVIKDLKDGTKYNLYKHLRPARQILAEEIKKQHYNKYNFWPEDGKSQESEVELHISSSYKSGNNFYIIWSCVGWIKVKDYCSKNYKEYNASFKGKPDIKVVIFNYEKLNLVEDSVNQMGFEKALEKIRKENKLITYDEF
ncbi:43492_t:CDS:2 [Gigaspora margarita]|uniref:43492_t:CDS:1 n=1 Tax=Gigaspora margarita TaxID=4874 RepID=A0ABM8VZB1_GIGMA|nr:43492_t:CDS:2 [Gigaspora margarita]